MFLIELTKPLDEINRLMKAHVQFLESGFRAGVFIAAGRQQPRVGGIILACACGRAKLDALMRWIPLSSRVLRRTGWSSSARASTTPTSACSPTRAHVQLVRKVIDSLTNW